MAADLVDDLIALARSMAPHVPPEQWAQVEADLRAAHGGRKAPYIRRRPAQQTKAGLIHRLEQATQDDQAADRTQLAHRLGVSVRTVDRYIPLIKGD